LLEAAFEIATRTGRTVYDSLYVALAVQSGCRLITADERLYNTLEGGPLGAYTHWIEDDLGMPAGGGRVEDVVLPDVVMPFSAEETELRYSYFTGDRLSDADLSRLAGMAEVRTLCLPSSGITDAGLVHLRGLVNLTTLYLDGTSVTDDGLAQLEGLVGLQTLNLAKTAITDAGLAHLRKLSGLHTLVLRGTHVTDAGLAHLRGLAGLRELDLEETLVTEAGAEDLRQALPTAKVIR
jgi:hypothetical protein